MTLMIFEKKTKLLRISIVLSISIIIAMIGITSAQIIDCDSNGINDSEEISNSQFSISKIASEPLSLSTSKKMLIDRTHSENFGISGFTDYLISQGWTVDQLSTGPIDINKLQGYDIFLIPIAYSSFSSSEINDIKAYVEQGGGLWLFNEYNRITTANSVSMEFGVTFNNDEIEDPTNNVDGTIFWPLIHILEVHPITEGVRSFGYYAGSSLNVNSPSEIIAKGDVDANSDYYNLYPPIIAAVEYGAGKGVFSGDMTPLHPNYFPGRLTDDEKLLLINIVNWLSSEDEQKPDFKIFDIKPVQVVWNADINNDNKVDLVAGKSTMIRVTMEVKNLYGQSPSEPIDIRLTFDGVDYTITKTISQLADEYGWEGVEGEEGTYRYYINFYLDSPPTTIGDLTVTAEVDPNGKIEEFDETNNQDEISVTVKETRDLNIEYLKINPPITLSYEAPDSKSFKETAEQSTKFIQATYPIRNNGVKYDINENYIGTPLLWGVPKFKIALPFEIFCIDKIEFDPSVLIGDLAALDISARLSGKDKIIGIVDHSYFEQHGYCYEYVKDGDKKTICSVGITTPIHRSALIEDGYYTPAAHEIGHSFGLGIKYYPPLNQPGPDEEYKIIYNDDCTPNIEKSYLGNSASGFWVEEKKSIENAICFMGTTPDLPKETLPQNLNRWICDKDYHHLFNVLKKGTDPNILLVNGYISKDDKIELGKWYYLENREIDDILPGEYSVELLDKNGEIVDEIKFVVHFFMFIEPFGAADIDPAYFSLEIPYPENAFKVHIKHNEKILTEINPNTKLLHDAINLIPNHGFIDNPEQRRKALYNKINEVEIKIEDGDIKDANNKLEFDIRDKLEKWLIDDYQKDTLQYSKDEIIDLVDEVIARLDSS